MLEKIGAFLKRGGRNELVAARELYRCVVEAARAPTLYRDAGIPDTVDGRFDSIAFHTYFLFQRMSRKPGWEEVGGLLADEIIADMDRSMREMGIGDMSIGKKVQKAAKAFYGRMDVYWGALHPKSAESDTVGEPMNDDTADALVEAIERNIFRGETAPGAIPLAEYAQRQIAFLEEQSDADILAGRVRFLTADDALVTVHSAAWNESPLVKEEP